MTPSSGTPSRRVRADPGHRTGGPPFFGGVHQELIGAHQRYDQVAEAFRRGGGARPVGLHPDVWAGTSRFTMQWHQNIHPSQPAVEPAPA